MNGWVRLWHDMPTDPKWRVVARKAQCSISEVIAVYVFLLVDASANATERGRTHSFNSEDVAAALDATEEKIDAILGAMQGKVLDGDYLTGWNKRQPKRERYDPNSAIRSKEWRQRKKSTQAANATRTPANASERLDTDTDTDTDKDTDKEGKTIKYPYPPLGKLKIENHHTQYPEDFESFWTAWGIRRKSDSKSKAYEAWQRVVAKLEVAPQVVLEGAQFYQGALDDPAYVKLAATWLNGRGWEEDYAETARQPHDPLDGIAERVASEMAANGVVDIGVSP